MKQSKEMEEFDKRFHYAEVLTEDVEKFISQNYIPKSAVEDWAYPDAGKCQKGFKNYIK